MDDYKTKRKEHTDRVANGYYLDKLPHICCNCGATDHLHYHHIVPLRQGGTNNISNIAVVCVQCHKAIHGEKESRKYNLKGYSGRSPKADRSTWNKTLDQFIKCEIGTKEVREILQLSDNTKLAQHSIYRRYLKDHGIKEVRNNIDIIKANGVYPPKAGKELGHITYIDDSKVIIRA